MNSATISNGSRTAADRMRAYANDVGKDCSTFASRYT
jgi:hypothetical protein